MIYLNNENIIIPNLLGITSASGFNIVFKNNVTNQEYAFNAEDESENPLYYSFNLDLSDLPNNEYTITLSVVGDETVTDVINNDIIGAAPYTYINWKKTINDSVYIGCSAGGGVGDSTIQIRTRKTNSGIVSRVSQGRLKKVILDWSDGPLEAHQAGQDNVVDIYGKNEPYESPKDLFDVYRIKQGDLLGQLEQYIPTGEDDEREAVLETILNVDGDYKYIGIRVNGASDNNNALYLNAIYIVWIPYTVVGTFIAQKGINNMSQTKSFDNETKYIQFEN